MFRRFGGDADRVLDGQRIGTAMADHHDSVRPEQQRAAVFGIIDEFADAAQYRGHQCRSIDGSIAWLGNCSFTSDSTASQKPSPALSIKLPTKPSQTTTSTTPCTSLFRFDIADEIQVAGEEELMGLFGEFVAFARLFADAQ